MAAQETWRRTAQAMAARRSGSGAEEEEEEEWQEGEGRQGGCGLWWGCDCGGGSGRLLFFILPWWGSSKEEERGEWQGVQGNEAIIHTHHDSTLPSALPAYGTLINQGPSSPQESLGRGPQGHTMRQQTSRTFSNPHRREGLEEGRFAIAPPGVRDVRSDLHPKGLKGALYLTMVLGELPWASLEPPSLKAKRIMAEPSPSSLLTLSPHKVWLPSLASLGGGLLLQRTFTGTTIVLQQPALPCTLLNFFNVCRVTKRGARKLCSTASCSWRTSVYHWHRTTPDWLGGRRRIIRSGDQTPWLLWKQYHGECQHQW